MAKPTIDELLAARAEVFDEISDDDRAELERLRDARVATKRKIRDLPEDAPNREERLESLRDELAALEAETAPLNERVFARRHEIQDAIRNAEIEARRAEVESVATEHEKLPLPALETKRAQLTAEVTAINAELEGVVVALNRVSAKAEFTANWDKMSDAEKRALRELAAK